MPLGAFGPLGTLGPVGNQIWNVSPMLAQVGDWSELSQHYTLNGGPISRSGPLGDSGPLSEEAIHFLNSESGLMVNLKANGKFAALGPFGPLGALGPLGPLGTLGAHGFAVNSNGEYLKDGVVQRVLSVDYNEKQTRVYELVETYPEAFAKQKTDNDGSFMVLGEIESKNGSFEKDSFAFVPREDQFIIMAVAPEYSLDQFAIKVTSAGGQQVLAADRLNQSHVLSFVAHKGQRYHVEITLLQSNHILSKRYRLISTASNVAWTQLSVLHLPRLLEQKKNCQDVL